MDTKTKRWTVRVTPAQDTIIRQVLAANGMSLSDYVVNHAVAAASHELADRRVFAVSPEAWQELQEALDRPPSPNPAVAALLAEPSILD